MRPFGGSASLFSGEDFMVPTATTVGGYLQSLPNDRRVAMARVCSMIRRSARGVRESMRFGLAFYEQDGPVFAVESHEKSLVLYFAEPGAAEGHEGTWKGLDVEHRRIVFNDLNCLPLDVVETVVRTSLKIRRARGNADMPTQSDLLKVWGIREEDAAVAPPIVRIVVAREDEDGNSAS